MKVVLYIISCGYALCSFFALVLLAQGFQTTQTIDSQFQAANSEELAFIGGAVLVVMLAVLLLGLISFIAMIVVAFRAPVENVRNLARVSVAVMILAFFTGFSSVEVAIILGGVVLQGAIAALSFYCAKLLGAAEAARSSSRY
ncbi:MAG: hypothetical protein EOO17_03330 [Chloroflexi bacterium]|nr:MAG: hypothetical protein EOO17_03330 [Chloroflexota bacterium]